MAMINGLKKEWDPAVKKHYEESQVNKEWFLFLALCSDDDRALLSQKSKMNLEDFDRISYLMMNLGLEKLQIYFTMQHLDLLQQSGRQIEENNASTIDVEKEVERAGIWEKEFLDQLPSEKMRYFLEKALYI